MIGNDILSWYEASLPAWERKKRGHFSTPPQLVEQLLDACGYRPENNLAHLRVLDPACGSGNLLAAATRRLIYAGRLSGQSEKALAASVQRNIWGFDPDPIACFLAEAQLRALLTTDNQQQTESTQGRVGRQKFAHLPLHIHQADGLAFPWEQCSNVDLFLANPPYLASKNNDLSSYRSAHQRGQADSYLLFLSLALQIVRPGGWIGLILPDPVLARANATKERQRLLAETTVHHLWHLSSVFSAHVGAAVIIAQKTPPQRLHQITWKREQWHFNSSTQNVMPTQDIYQPLTPVTEAEKKTIAQMYLGAQRGAELRYLLSEARGTLVARLHTHIQQADATDTTDGCDTPRVLARLSNFVTVRRGEEIGKHSSLLSKLPLNDQELWHPVLRGGVDMQPYSLPMAHCWIARQHVAKPVEHYQAPKLLVVKSTGRLQATLDLQGHVVLQTLYLLNLHKSSSNDLALQESRNDDLYFLLALLNSRLLQEYVYVLYTAYKWVQPQIEQHVLAHLPIPLIESAEKAHIITRAKLLMRACSEIAPVVELKTHRHVLYEEQERAICTLYESALMQAIQQSESSRI